MTAREGTARIQSVDRAVDLLLAVAAAGPAAAGVPALAQGCGLNRATAWRLLKTLQARGMVTVDEAGRYALGLTALELGGAAGPDAVIAAAHPVLERLCAETGETASLAMPRRRRADLRRRGHPGRGADGELARPHRAAARHVDGQGAARVPAARRAAPGAARGAAGVHRHHDHHAGALDAELAATRARGYGTCAGELESSLYGVSAPVLDRTGRPLAVLAIWGPEGPGARADVRAAGGHRRAGRPGGRWRARGAGRQLCRKSPQVVA